MSGCQAFCSSVSVDSISVFIFERGSVSSWEFLFLPLASLNLDHFLHTKIGVTRLAPRLTHAAKAWVTLLFTRLQFATLYAGWKAGLTKLHLVRYHLHSRLCNPLQEVLSEKWIHFTFLFFPGQTLVTSLITNEPPTPKKLCQILCRRWSASQHWPVIPHIWQYYKGETLRLHYRVQHNYINYGIQQ